MGGAGSGILTGGPGIDALYGDFENGIDKLDMTALGIVFGDLTITSMLDGHAHIAYAGNLISVAFAAGQIDSADFVF